jgi:hypothetical protein
MATDDGARMSEDAAASANASSGPASSVLIIALAKSSFDVGAVFIDINVFLMGAIYFKIYLFLF